MNQFGTRALSPLLLGALLAGACTQQDAPAAAETAAGEKVTSQPAAPGGEVPAGVLATVNGVSITQGTLEPLRTRQGNEGLDQDALVQEAINVELMKQAADKEGISESPAVTAKLESLRTQVLASEVLRAHVAGLSIDDAALKVEYDKQIAGNPGKEFKARHILVADEQTAKDVIAKLDGGADFAELAKTTSTGPSGPKGGDLGWFQPATMVPEFAAAASEMNKGEYSKTPVQTQFGWHVILLEDVRTPEPPPFDDVKDQLRQILVQQSLLDYLKELRSGATIKIAGSDGG
ncbi:MAG: peptidyl-prolyl cis-trans isomerase [Pseudomonadota bacterium]|nr:peptidyl-prolyl cis-trans isomerase [Pseudomonadota bacterium]